MRTTIIANVSRNVHSYEIASPGVLVPRIMPRATERGVSYQDKPAPRPLPKPTPQYKSPYPEPADNIGRGTVRPGGTKMC